MSLPESLPDHVVRNRASPDEVTEPLYAEPGRRAWARPEITWAEQIWRARKR
jgi:hypothetical protein